MQQIKSVVCRQAYVTCWSDVLVKNDQMSVYFLFEAISEAFLSPKGQINIRVSGQSGQSNFILIAI